MGNFSAVIKTHFKWPSCNPGRFGTIRCDECQLCYHFGCLDPPLKKSPKQTGYGWICQECDTSSSKEQEEEARDAEEDSVTEETYEQI